MYQHTVVSAAPACGDHVPIRSHIQALCAPMTLIQEQTFATMPRSQGCQGGPSQPRQVLGARVARRVRRARIALKPLKPHVSIRDEIGPQTAVCTHCKARHWECERSKSTRHFGACCSQGKVRLPPPPQPNLEYRQLLQGSDSEAKAFRENARSYNNALSFTSLAAHWDQTQVGTLGPPVFRVFGRLYHRLAHLPGRGHRHSTWTRRRRQSHTKIYFDQAQFYVAYRQSLGEGTCIGQSSRRLGQRVGPAPLPAGRDRRTHNLPTSSTEMAMIICDSDINTGDRGPQDLILQVHGDRCPGVQPKYQIVSSLHPSAMPLRYPLLFPAEEDSSHLNIPLCAFNQFGPLFAKRPRRGGRGRREW
ncbi:BQ5605_C027g10403 [Microbotryum silenes-dioicae]|uniref:BQ5605_C027g10403 protein n=1 Tax=Microbotryum silenes-dioicae TaxID=796604 RepID=A0A2X0PNH1_9BASI|nr:BQ5605_C027g10403 [Microbotryum silenes-dioicae]